METKFVLIAHDTPEQAESIRSLIAMCKIRSVIVESASEAKDVLTDENEWNLCYGCVIDIGLRDGIISGWQLAAWIRDYEISRRERQGSRKWLIGMTAYEPRALYLQKDKVFDYGFQQPYAPAKLVSAILSEINRRVG